MRAQPLICVTDVEASSRWYQRLLNCRGAHGGRQYEQLVKDGGLILQLHSFEVEHHHGPIGNPADRPYGNGVLLWFEIEDFDAVMQRAAEMGVEIVLPRHRNPADGEAAPTTGSVGCATRMATLSWSPALMEPPMVPGAPALIYSPKSQKVSPNENLGLQTWQAVIPKRNPISMRRRRRPESGNPSLSCVASPVTRDWLGPASPSPRYRVCNLQRPVYRLVVRACWRPE